MSGPRISANHNGLRRFAIPIMVGVAVVVIGAALMWESRSADDAGGKTPAVTNLTGAASVGVDQSDAQVPTTSAGASVPDTPTSTTVQTDGPGAVAAEDVELLARLSALLAVATPEQSLIFLSTNVPQDEVARCMADAGFQYLPGPSPEEDLAASPGFDLSIEEWTAAYGLGITAGNLGLLPPSPPDPNLDYRSSLTEGQLNAYNAAYFVCRGSTPERIAHSNALNVSVTQFRDTLAADDRVIEAEQAWRGCMADAGFRFDSPQAMQESFYSRMDGGISRDQLRQLHTEEVATAVANIPCKAAYDDAVRAVVLDRFDEYQQLYEAALASGDAPDAQG